MYHPIPQSRYPFDGGGLFPTFTQFTVYKTNTHIYSQAIHVPDGGGGLAARAKRPGPAQTGQCETIHNPASAPCALVRFAAHENSSGSNGKRTAKTPQQTALYGQQTCTMHSMGIFQGPVIGPCIPWCILIYSFWWVERTAHRAGRRAKWPDQN